MNCKRCGKLVGARHKSFCSCQCYHLWVKENPEFTRQRAMKMAATRRKLGSFISWSDGLTKHTDKRVAKIAEKLKGRKPSPESIEKHRQKMIGKHIWKGKIHPMAGKHHTQETKEKIRKAMKGRPSWCKSLTKHDHPSLMSASQKKTGKPTWNKGKPFLALEKNPRWRNGASFEPYGQAFNNTLKAQIRARDRFRCQECFRHQSELPCKLHVHHIDFNKKNNSPDNLISLCRNCHMQIGFNQKDWIEYFKDRLGGLAI